MGIKKKTIAAHILHRTGGGSLLRAFPRWEGLLVLSYHRIGDASASPYDRGHFSASADIFAEQVDFLKKNADVISPGDISALRRRATGRSVLITFDDGYRDNYELAFPILRAAGVPAAFFICTGFLDRGELAWWDEIAWMIRASDRTEITAGKWIAQRLPFDTEAQREEAIQTALQTYRALTRDRAAAFMAFLRDATGAADPPASARDIWMTWDMVREMRDAGMTIGAHTETHPALGKIPVEEQEREIYASRARLIAELGQPPKSFSYPVGKPGSYSVTTKRMVQEADFSYGFNLQGGSQAFSTFDAFDIRRCRVGAGIDMAMFEAMLTLPSTFTR